MTVSPMAITNPCLCGMGVVYRSGSVRLITRGTPAAPAKWQFQSHVTGGVKDSSTPWVDQPRLHCPPTGWSIAVTVFKSHRNGPLQVVGFAQLGFPDLPGDAEMHCLACARPTACTVTTTPRRVL